MTNQPPRELFITEFKNMSDSWIPLHAYNSKTNAELDAGLSGRVIHAIEAKPVLDKIARLEAALKKCVDAVQDHADAGNIEHYRILSDKLESILEV